jgi:8-oxo-dGTP diphosphatase
MTRGRDDAVRAWPVALERVLAAKHVTRTPRAARPIAAAGGVVWRTRRRQVEVVVIHRVAHDDWSLPKGGAAVGEALPACARREVLEETGYECRIGEMLTSSRYRDQDGRPKVVQWFAMTPERGVPTISVEVDAVRWMPVSEARSILTKERDRLVLDELCELLQRR